MERVLARSESAESIESEFGISAFSRISKQELSALHSELKALFDSDSDLDSDSEPDLDSDSELNSKPELESELKSKLKSDSDRRRLRRRKEDILTVDKGEDDGYVSCLDRHMKLYLRMEEVQEAIHVKKYKWGDCALKVIKMWPESDYYTYVIGL